MGSTNPKLILASASPRRAELLREHGYKFEVVASPLPEPTTLPAHMSPAEQAEFLSYFKAASVADWLDQQPAIERVAGSQSPGDAHEGEEPSRGRSAPQWPILAADTIAVFGDRVFGKPVDRADAKRILSSIAGTTHQVITAVTLMDPVTRRHVTRHDVTAVHMRPLEDAELEEYLASNAWCGKAGAYGIQDYGDRFVTRIEGSFSNVVGLPMELLGKMLSEWNREPDRI